MAWTAPYSLPLVPAQIAHFLRRATFGASPTQLRTYGNRTAAALFDDVAKVGIPDPPTDQAGKTFHNVPWGAPGTTPQERNNVDRQRRTLLQQSWLGLMLDPQRGFGEKLTLFWQNHFVVVSDEVQDVRYLHRYLDMIRHHALGNFRTFVIEVTRDPAMLYYLNGTQNTKDKPNENYGRELMELFTLGRGTFAEADVKEAARVLTGWKAVNYRNSTSAEISSRFERSQHDLGKKTFSEHFQNKVIDGYFEFNDGEKELGELIDMLLGHPESARFVVRKLYRWYFAGEISDEVEKNFIEPLAAGFRQDFQLLPLIKRMLTSDHFFDPALRGGQLRSPLDFILGTFMVLEIPPLTPVYRDRYDMLTGTLLKRTRLLEMEVLAQPTVFGWSPYYDSGFYKIWISGTTLGLRGEFTDLMVQGMPQLGTPINLVSWVASFVRDPGDPLVLVRDLWEALMAVEPSPEQLDALVDDALLDGIPRYEWYEIWNKYASKGLEDEVRQYLDPLVAYLLRHAEYQLG